MILGDNAVRSDLGLLSFVGLSLPRGRRNPQGPALGDTLVSTLDTMRVETTRDLADGLMRGDVKTFPR